MSNKGIGIAAALIAAGVALDQVTKVWASNNLPGNPMTLVSGVFDLRYVRNYAAAFGIGGVIPENLRIPLLLVVTIGLTLGLTWGMVKSPDLASQLGFGITIAGAIGNIIDRVRLGFVVDFFYWYKWFVWPAFNVADVFVCTGIGILLVFGGKAEKAARAAEAPKDAAPSSPAS